VVAPDSHLRLPLVSAPLAAGRRSRVEFAFPDGVNELSATRGLLARLVGLKANTGGTYVDFPADLSSQADYWDLGMDGRGYDNDPLWTARPIVPRGAPVPMRWCVQYPVRDDLGGVVPARDPPFHHDYRVNQLLLTVLGGMTEALADTYEHRARPSTQVGVVPSFSVGTGRPISARCRSTTLPSWAASWSSSGPNFASSASIELRSTSAIIMCTAQNPA
jgi:hypothetical protein